jgi:hypothetical protein
MSESRRVHTIRLPLRKIGATLPAVALISAGIMLPSSAASTAASRVGLAAKSSPAIVVPDTPITLPNSWQNTDSPNSERSLRAAPVAEPLGLALPAGTVPGSSSPVTLDNTGIPVRALEGYRQAATLISAADPSCHLDWPLLAAIGRVESDHARFGGNQLDASGVARPGIIGIPLDGSNGTARITDTDQGLLDRDTTFDRAVGPMQFIPSTWRFAGVDANGDGVKDPQSMADSSAATAVYLCSGSADLRNPADLRSAILRYNPSDSYVSMVTAIADAYRHGVKALPASDVAPVKLTTVKSRTSAAAAKPAKLVPGKPAARAPGSTPAQKTAPKPKATTPVPAGSIPAVTQVPSTTPPGSPQPTPSTSSTPTSTSTTPAPTATTPSPTTTCVPIPSATSSTASGAPSPAPTTTCLPPCEPTASATSPASPQTCLPPCEPAVSPTSGTTPATPALPCLTPAASTAATKATP